ncbi:glycoside hydrolase family 25 protein [Lichenihabitans psoromatis]|uniref:glycoside hydrolase family 25 protein n=1 Tax=Lichenihabitans psoromatis TaxID=2528642 RepID=UPI00103840C6|nr:GH25 family lysozyme [Lichenihabitans psoromatis]
MAIRMIVSPWKFGLRAAMGIIKFLAATMAAISLAGCAATVGSLDATDLPHPTDYSVHGIDVSKYQGKIDWDRVKSSGVRFAWIKATEGGDHVDSRFFENWENAKAAGVKRGAYHFVYWCRPWQEEIAFFERVAPVEPDALPPVLDVEATPTSKSCKRTLYRDEVVAQMRQMLAEMERHFGKKPVIYTTVDFYAGILQNHALEDYPIWVRSTKYFPSIKYGNRRWHFWQYQSDGHIDGIEGKVDRNAFFGTAEQWQDFTRGRNLLELARN